MTAESILKEKELDVGGAFSVYDTDPSEPTSYLLSK